MTTTFTKTLHLGKCDYHHTGKKTNSGSLTLRIETKETNSRDWDTLIRPEGMIHTVSICGEIRDGRDGGEFGQIIDTISAMYPTDAVKRIVEFWREWHLNDMCAGTKAQTEFLDAYIANRKNVAEFNRELRADYYGTCCRILSVEDLLIHCGYKYGTEWLIKIVSQDVIDELKLLFSSND